MPRNGLANHLVHRLCMQCFMVKHGKSLRAPVIVITKVLKFNHVCKMQINKGGAYGRDFGWTSPGSPQRNLVLWSPPAPIVPLVHTQGCQALLWRQHCRASVSANTESTVKMHATILTANVGAFGSRDYDKVGACGGAKKNLAKGHSKRDSYQKDGFPQNCSLPIVKWDNVLYIDMWKLTSPYCCHMRCCTA